MYAFAVLGNRSGRQFVLRHALRVSMALSASLGQAQRVDPPEGIVGGRISWIPWQSMQLGESVSPAASAFP